MRETDARPKTVLVFGAGDVELALGLPLDLYPKRFCFTPATGLGTFFRQAANQVIVEDVAGCVRFAPMPPPMPAAWMIGLAASHG